MSSGAVPASCVTCLLKAPSGSRFWKNVGSCRFPLLPVIALKAGSTLFSQNDCCCAGSPDLNDSDSAGNVPNASRA